MTPNWFWAVSWARLYTLGYTLAILNSGIYHLAIDAGLEHRSRRLAPRGKAPPNTIDCYGGCIPWADPASDLSGRSLHLAAARRGSPRPASAVSAYYL